jgi:N-acyl homoserine lactone hydrolase
MKWLAALAITAMALGAVEAAAEAAPVKLWRMDCGTIKVNDLNLFSDSFQYAGQSKTLTNSCYLIQHGDAYMIWDTGFPKSMQNALVGDAVLSPTFTLTVADQLKQLGVAPDAISKVGVSHDHFDHIGQAADFAGATLLIGKGDMATIKSGAPAFGVDPKLVAPWLKGGAVEEIDGDKDVFGDGSVTILTTPGHTHGSLSLLVRLQKTGPVILSGDTVHFEEQFANQGVPSFNVDRSQSLASMDRLQDIATNLKATLIVQHDASDISKLPAFPLPAE